MNNYNDLSPIDVDGVALDKIRCGLIERLHRSFFEVDVDIDPFLSYLEDEICAKVSVLILGHSEISKDHWKYPATWWQHFKEDCFPEALKAIWPVKYTVKNLSIDAIYPDLIPPNHKPVLLFHEREHISKDIANG